MKAIPKFKVDGILFDLGSTLLEYETIPWSILDIKALEAGYAFLKEEGYSVPEPEKFGEKYLEIRTRIRDASAITLREWKMSELDEEFLRSLNINGGPELAARFFDSYYQPISRQLTLFADAHHVLRKIRSMGKKIGLVSNTFFPEEYHIRELDRFELTRYFDFTLYSVTFGYRKPHPAIFRRAIDLMKLLPEQLLFIGDRFREDYLGAKENGMNAILKYREGREYPDPFPEDVIVVHSLAESLDYIGE